MATLKQKCYGQRYRVNDALEKSRNCVMLMRWIGQCFIYVTHLIKVNGSCMVALLYNVVFRLRELFHGIPYQLVRIS